MARCRAGCFALASILIAIAGAAPLRAQPSTQDARRSGYDMMSPELQAMQREDAANPGMLWVREGEALWRQKPAPDKRACAECHGDAAQSMRGVAARYPMFDAVSGKPIDLTGRIMQCRAERQATSPLAREGRVLNALTTYVAHQSRGMPLTPPQDARLAPAHAQGEALFGQRLGQLGLSCKGCHDLNAGQKLGGSVVPGAHPTGYPIYRLEWQNVGSLQRRLRNCMIGVRAEPFAYGSDEFIALELYLAQRAAGMKLETPGVRP